MIYKEMPESEVLKQTKSCNCDACVNGCKFGSGFLASGDKEKIAKFLGLSVESLEKECLEEVNLYNKQMWRPKVLKGDKPYGPCVFLEGGICKVHSVKPLECKIAMPCSPDGEKLIQWFLVNHAVNAKDEFSLKLWGEYLKENEAIPGGSVREILRLKN